MSKDNEPSGCWMSVLVFLFVTVIFITVFTGIIDFVMDRNIFTVGSWTYGFWSKIVFSRITLVLVTIPFIATVIKSFSDEKSTANNFEPRKKFDFKETSDVEEDILYEEDEELFEESTENFVPKVRNVSFEEKKKSSSDKIQKLKQFVNKINKDNK